MKSTEKEWDEVRVAFSTSIMVDTAINSLAQNLDGPEWPIKGKDETPAKYIDLTLEEAVEMIQLKGQKPELMDRLVSILKETLAFDSPFGEMVEQTQASESRDNPLLKNLAKLGIPENFPVALTALDTTTQEFCAAEKLTTLGEFAVTAQGMAQKLIVGGDFKKLLNALSYVDEAALTEVLPFRRGAKGLHLVEATGQATRAANPPAREVEVVAWFREELAAIENDVSAGGSLERHFVVLGNAELEKKAVALLRPHLKLKTPVAAEPAEKKGGFFSRLFGRK